MPVERMAMRRKHIVPWVVDLIVTAVGAWVAALLVPAFELSGAVGEQVVAVAVVTVTFVAATAVVPIPLFRPMRRAYTRNMSDLMAEPDFDVSDKQFFAPVRRMFTLGLVNTAIRLLIYLVLAPAALWLASTALEAASLPTRLTGFWPTVVAALVVLATRSVLSRLLRWPFGRARARRYIGGLAEYVLTLAALLVALAVLGGASVVNEPGEPVALSVIVFTGLYVLGDFELTVPFLTTVIRIAINALKLWLVSWLSGFMVVGLAINGFWTFVLAAIIIWAFTVPARWPRRRREAQRRQQEQMQMQMMHDMQHTHWNGPYY